MRRTHTSESLCAVTVPNSHHQWKEVDLTEASDGALHHTKGPTCRPPITDKPLGPSLPTLQLVLTTTLQSQSQTLLT